MIVWVIFLTWCTVGFIGMLLNSWVNFHSWGKYCAPVTIVLGSLCGIIAVVSGVVGLIVNSDRISASLRNRDHANGKRSFLCWFLTPGKGDK